ncbi:CheW domain-containing protein [Phytopseudomonas punonensis]|uniref:Purine-binding chemotaxis protein CheW n=1 Tax=Phytopseudomonas punonensis TaxID=1220495 RepID=A0A1M7N6F3_9GAMM|nr:CheW domain-containing protein [Pseudomonas punonensis]SHM99154.1 purine-binding chemotaxis protein CheW [Pseudomonas punonensis]
MSRSTATATRPQLALQSYLDGLLQDAAIELEQELAENSLDEFEAAVLEEQVRDAQLTPRAEVPALALVQPVVEVVSEPAVEALAPTIVEPIPLPPVVEPVADVHRPAPQIFSSQPDGRPDWAEEPFECLLFDVAGLTLAVPLVCLGSIYPLAGQDLTPLFGQPDWFLGILPSQSGNLKVLDTARWVMPDRYRDDFREGLQYVISVQGYEWGLAVHQVSRSIRLNPDEIKWRSQRSQRPWLAGTVIEHMCALLDVAALAELIASGATKRMSNGQIH